MLLQINHICPALSHTHYIYCQTSHSKEFELVDHTLLSRKVYNPVDNMAPMSHLFPDHMPLKKPQYSPLDLNPDFQVHHYCYKNNCEQINKILYFHVSSLN